MIAHLTLVDDDGNSYVFPDSIFIKEIGWKKTSNIKNIPFAHGGRDIADGYLEPRNILVEGALRADNHAALEVLARAFNKAVYAGGKLSVSDDSVTRYIYVGGADVAMDYIGDYRLEVPVSVTFIAEYPFWQADPATSGGGVVTDGDSITVDNSGSDMLSYPIITIEADQGADVPAVKLQNVSDGGMIFEYQDSNFKQGDTVTIDTYAGTVKRNGNSTIEFVTQARFPRLQNLVNTIIYEGADCTITIEFREVYL